MMTDTLNSAIQNSSSKEN